MSEVNDESKFQSVDIQKEDDEDLFKSAIDTSQIYLKDNTTTSSNISNCQNGSEENKLNIDSTGVEKREDDEDLINKGEDEKSEKVTPPTNLFSNTEFKELPTIQLSQTKNILSPISPLETPMNDNEEEDLVKKPKPKTNAETNNNTENFIRIDVTEPNKIGDGYGAYVAYRVETTTNIKDFRRTEMIVPRRFSDFLALHEKLVEKYLKNGRIIPPAPGKDIMGTTKIKMSSQPDQEQDFVEKRRKALERYLRRTAAHPVLRDDPDFREFLESDGELPKATNTSALSSAGMLRFINRFGETVQKFSFKMDETDQWFADKTILIDNIESQLSNLHFSIENLTINRRELSFLCGHFAESIAMLSNMEEHATLSRVLAQLSELYEKIKTLYLDEALCDFDIFCELFKDYVSLIGAVKDTFHARVKIYQTWQSWQIILNKKRETKVKLELAGRSDKSIQAANEVIEWEHKVERCQEDFNAISSMIKREFDQFDLNRVQEFKVTLCKYIEKLLFFQTETIKCWQGFIPEVKTIQLKQSSVPSN